MMENNFSLGQSLSLQRHDKVKFLRTEKTELPVRFTKTSLGNDVKHIHYKYYDHISLNRPIFRNKINNMAGLSSDTQYKYQIPIN